MKYKLLVLGLIVAVLGAVLSVHAAGGVKGAVTDLDLAAAHGAGWGTPEPSAHPVMVTPEPPRTALPLPLPSTYPTPITPAPTPEPTWQPSPTPVPSPIASPIPTPYCGRCGGTSGAQAIEGIMCPMVCVK
jgi:hypothetical protein